MAVPYVISNPETWGYYYQSGSNTNLQRPMGLGPIGAKGIVFKRKFRWTLQIQYCTSSGNDADIKVVSPEWVKVASRPNLAIEETEINYLHGKMFLPGKATWESMEVTYYDVAGRVTTTDLTTDDQLTCITANDAVWSPAGTPTENATDYLVDNAKITSVLGWLASVYDFTNGCEQFMGSKLGDYTGQGLLLLYDGCGQVIEAWIMHNMWPTNVNFGDLDMSNSDTCDITLTMRYSTISYRNLCPAQSIVKCVCNPCLT